MSSAVVVHRVDRATRVIRVVRRLGMAFVFAVCGLSLGNVAHAFWSGGGVGEGVAHTGTLTPPTGVAATSPPGSDSVAVRWDAAEVSGAGSTVVAYYVRRTPEEGGLPSAACGTSPTELMTAVECTDLMVADGAYRYEVTAVLDSWTAESSPSATVMVHANVDAPSVTATTSPAPNDLGYNRTSPVTVQITATDIDGVESITYSVDDGTPMTVTSASTYVPVSGEGTHTVTYSAVDTFGKRSPSGTRVVRIDTTAPATPTTPVLTAASDSGDSSSDGITNDRSPTFSGTAEPGATVRLSSDGSLVALATAGLDGAYSVTSGTTLASGTRQITVQAVDAAGNVSASSPTTTVTIDYTAPVTPRTPTLTTPSDSGRSSADGVTNVATPSFADDGSSGSSDVVGAVLYDGGVQVGSATASPGYTVTASQLAEGVHSMTVRVSDAAGNVSAASSARSVTVDTVAPVAPSAPVLAASSDSGASSSDGVTNVVTPTMVGSNEAAAIVTLFDAATQVGVQTTAGGSYAVVSSTLSEGSHTFKVTATDVAGNVGPASGGTTITIDITAPTAPGAPLLSAASDSGVSSSDRLTKVTTPTFTGTAPNNSNVTLFDGNDAVAQPTRATGGSWTATSIALNDGTRSFTARTDPDVAGNVGISPATTVTIDTTGPVADISVLSTTAVIFRFSFEESVYSTGANITLSGTARPTSYTISGSGPYDVKVTGMDRSGTVIVNLGAGQVMDAAGNGNGAQTSNTNVINYVDSEAPAVAITQLAAASGRSALVEGTAGISPGDNGTVTVVLCTTSGASCPPAETVATLTATVGSRTGVWSVTSGSLGAHAQLYARAFVTDLSGNSGVSTAAGPVTIP